MQNQSTRGRTITVLKNLTSHEFRFLYKVDRKESVLFSPHWIPTEFNSGGFVPILALDIR